LIDLKVDRLRKKDIFVLTSAGEIVWLIGLRISETFKIGPQTQETIWFTCE
jgi:tRNA(Ile)-lysidine synthase